MGYHIVTFDEASFRLVPVYKRTWYIKGEKPRGIFFWSNKKVIVFGALIDGKKFYHEFFDAMNTLTYKAFLSNFIKTLRRGKYVFIFDNAPYHKSSTINHYLATFEKTIVPEFLPPYTPECNPTETVWKITRHDITNNHYYPTIDELQNALENFFSKHFFKLEVSNYLCR